MFEHRRILHFPQGNGVFYLVSDCYNFQDMIKWACPREKKRHVGGKQKQLILNHIEFSDCYSLTGGSQKK